VELRPMTKARAGTVAKTRSVFPYESMEIDQVANWGIETVELRRIAELRYPKNFGSSCKSERA
jgi:hypothetical protein